MERNRASMQRWAPSWPNTLLDLADFSGGDAVTALSPGVGVVWLRSKRSCTTASAFCAWNTERRETTPLNLYPRSVVLAVTEMATLVPAGIRGMLHWRLPEQNEELLLRVIRTAASGETFSVVLRAAPHVVLTDSVKTAVQWLICVTVMRSPGRCTGMLMMVL